MKHFLTTLICLMLITACGENKSKKTSFSTDDYLHVIDLNKTGAEIQFSEVFASITPIILETTKNSLIGDVDKVFATDEYIIVLDAFIANALFLFKKDGTFLHKFGSRGNGPGEYSRIADFCYDNTTGTIYMLDFSTNRINIYDIHTGSFLKSLKLQNNNGFSQYICFQSEELYTNLRNFTNATKQYLLNRRSQTTGNIEESWLDLETYSKNIDYTERNPFLFSNGNSFKFNKPFMDGIMLVEKGKITPFLTFTPEYTIDLNDLKGVSKDSEYMEVFSMLRGLNKVFNITPYFEHKDLIYMNFWLGTAEKALIYNQKTKDFKYMSTFDDLIYKEKNSHFRQYPWFIAHYDNGLFAVQDVQFIKELLEKDLISENFKSSALDLVNNLEEDANPFLFYYEFKK